MLAAASTVCVAALTHESLPAALLAVTVTRMRCPPLAVCWLASVPTLVQLGPSASQRVHG